MQPERRSQRERLALRGALLRLTPPLEAFAEDVLGLGSRIDLVARDPDGAVTLILVAAAENDLARLGEGIAQRVWLAPRLADWNQLAPHLALVPERGVHLLLVAPRFDERTRTAAAALGQDWVRLAERVPRGDLDVDLRPLDGAEAPHSAPAGFGRADAGFRTSLRD